MVMRVGINAQFWDRAATGSGQYLRNLVPALEQASDDEYLLIGPRRIAVSGPRPGNEYLASTPFDGYSEKAAKLYFEQIAFPRLCRELELDLAHVPYFASPLLPPLPTVVTVHDLIPIVLPAYRGSLLVRLYTGLVAAAARRAQLILTDSESSRRDILARLGVPAERVRVIYLAPGADYLPVTDRARLEMTRRKYRLPEQFILYLGGFDRRKNVQGLLQAYKSAGVSPGQKYPLVLAGRLPTKESALFPNLRRIIAQLELEEAVVPIGWVAEEDKPALYTLASLFVYPSFYEGFGLPVLEAMACGTPVVVSRAASLPEIVGEAGLLVDPQGVTQIGRAIVSVLSDETLRRELREKGLAQARRFSWQKTAQQTLAAYREVLEAGRT
jgi:glycosyltransferase involved in cell wall biosynthesis